jgi:hypothetical protein
METTCTRCHQAVEADACFCPFCGLPQLVYSTEDAEGQMAAETGNAPVRDAGSVDWKPAIRTALTLAIPAGILCSMLSPVSILGLLLMAGTSAWVVAIYLRKEKPAWLTIGAGARIGLVTGLLGAWTAAGATGLSLFSMRFFFHQGKDFDNLWENLVNNQLTQQWNSMGIDAHTIALTKAWMMSPAGRAGWVVGTVSLLSVVLLLFAVAGGALGARMLGRPRPPQL